MSADLQFKQLIDRILRCREAEDAAKDDTKEVYAELKTLGYDKTAAGALVGELRKKDKDPEKFTERNATLDLYRDAYERAGVRDEIRGGHHGQPIQLGSRLVRNQLASRGTMAAQCFAPIPGA